MRKSVLVISTSLRQGSNSDLLAEEFIRGAREAGHTVEKVSLAGKEIGFCRGCMACQRSRSGHCVIQDDADAIVQKMAQADVLVFATPIYYYEMSGQMKTLLDRANPLFPVDYAFREVYLLTAAADEDPSAMDGAVKGLEGWVACFEKCRLAGVVRGTGADAPGEIRSHAAHGRQTYDMGHSIR